MRQHRQQEDAQAGRQHRLWCRTACTCFPAATVLSVQPVPDRLLLPHLPPSAALMRSTVISLSTSCVYNALSAAGFAA